ncbi:Protein kinase domain containing protein, partial [Reticulomyxa filosa]
MATSALKHGRYESAPTDPVDDVLKERGKSPFPKQKEFSGYLDVRTRSTKSWKRRYFALSNNFLLMAETEHAKVLERVISLEGTTIKNSMKTSKLTFELLSKKKRYTFRAANTTECSAWLTHIQKASKLHIKDVYKFEELLGQNDDGTTKVVSARHRVSNEEVAVKAISKRHYDARQLQNEVLILRRLDHPNVVKLYDLFETKNTVYLVMEKLRKQFFFLCLNSRCIRFFFFEIKKKGERIL